MLESQARMAGQINIYALVYITEHVRIIRVKPCGATLYCSSSPAIVYNAIIYTYTPHETK